MRLKWWSIHELKMQSKYWNNLTKMSHIGWPIQIGWFKFFKNLKKIITSKRKTLRFCHGKSKLLFKCSEQWLKLLVSILCALVWCQFFVWKMYKWQSRLDSIEKNHEKSFRFFALLFRDLSKWIEKSTDRYWYLMGNLIETTDGWGLC